MAEKALSREDFNRHFDGAAKKHAGVEKFARYYNDPVGFFVDILGIDPWSRQREIIEAVGVHDRVAVKAGQKVSKSNTVAGLAVWFYATRPDARVIFTNSSARQVREVNYREIKKVIRKAPVRVEGELHDTPDRGMQAEDGRQIVGFTTDEPDRWGGISGENLMFLVDEASGVPGDVFEAIHGNSAGGNVKILLTGNPLRASEYFHHACTTPKSLYNIITVSSYDSPNVTGERRIPGLATPEWIAEMVEVYGTSSTFVSARIRGEFPVESEGQIFTSQLIEQAKARYSAEAFDNAGDLELGVDVSRFGDDETVVFARRGNQVRPPYVFRKLDNYEVADRVMNIADELRRGYEEVTVRVDEIGIGSGVVDILRRQSRLSVIGVNVGESSWDKRFNRRRDEVWWNLRDFLLAGGSLPPDAKLEGELSGPTYSYTASQKIQVESKDELKKRLKRSPDRADALCLAVWKRRSSSASSSYWSPMHEGGHDPEREIVKYIEQRHFCYVGGSNRSDEKEEY